MEDSLNLFTAPLFRRLFAFIIDAVAAFVPAFVVTLIIIQAPFTHHLLAPVLYAAPLEGAYTLIEIPGEVNQILNDAMPGTEEYAATELRNVSVSSTFARILSVFCILFYVFYGLVATLLFDGVTAGKYCVGIQTVYIRNGNATVGIVLREFLGKIILNSLGLFLISIITMIVTPKHYAIHDFIGGTRVVYTTSRKSLKIRRPESEVREDEEIEESADESEEVSEPDLKNDAE